MSDVFTNALETALKQLAEMKAERDHLAERLAALDSEIPIMREKITSLAALVDDIPADSPLGAMLDAVVTMGLTDAVREALKTINDARTPLEIKNWLLRRRYDLTPYSNVMATIHVVLKRLIKSKEVEEVKKDGEKAYKWIRATSRLRFGIMPSVNNSASQIAPINPRSSGIKPIEEPKDKRRLYNVEIRPKEDKK